MKKILNILFCLVVFSASSYANNISSYIKKSGIENNSTVSVYLMDKSNNKVVYKKSENKLLNPASSLKLLTFGASYLVLGENYKFETSVYKDSKNNLYIKLGCDPMLSYFDLVQLFSDAKSKIDVKKINNIFIDDSIIDKIPYPDTWMQEDIWPNQRAITPYIIDNNYTEVVIKRSSLATKVDIIQNDEYKIPVINELKLGDIQDYKILREYGDNSPIITFRGAVKQDEIKKLPILNPQINFVIKTNKALYKNNYFYENKIQYAKTPKNAVKIASVNHTIEEVSKNILHNSDNFYSEIVSKVASAKYIEYSHPATNDDMINMFYDVYKNVITSEITIADSSGVSRKNLLNAKFLVEGLIYIENQVNLNDLMLKVNQGTLSNRLLFLGDKLRAKTGTLSNMSSITGLLTTNKSNNLVFSIVTQNSPKRSAILKNFEDNIISIIYRKY